jgi:hypothetical protein
MKASDLIIPIVTLILGAGGLRFIQAFFRGVGSLRGGARALEREAVTDIARSRDRADERAEWAEADRDFWHDTGMRWKRQLIVNGVDPVPPDPVPPSARRGHTKPSTPD